MKQHPGLRFEIQGYVCCVPEESDGYDIESHAADLSVQRAKYVYLFLKGNGVDSTRISYMGFGARHKIFPMERNDEEMKRNRRVEIKVLGW
jgi:outer membrane protein OmpA-like peptidoglycan-associated protein